MAFKPRFHLSNFGRSLCLHFDATFADLVKEMTECYVENTEVSDEMMEVLHAFRNRLDQHYNYVAD